MRFIVHWAVDKLPQRDFSVPSKTKIIEMNTNEKFVCRFGLNFDWASVCLTWKTTQTNCFWLSARLKQANYADMSQFAFRFSFSMRWARQNTIYLFNSFAFDNFLTNDRRANFIASKEHNEKKISLTWFPKHIFSSFRSANDSTVERRNTVD